MLISQVHFYCLTQQKHFFCKISTIKYFLLLNCRGHAVVGFMLLEIRGGWDTNLYLKCKLHLNVSYLWNVSSTWKVKLTTGSMMGSVHRVVLHNYLRTFSTRQGSVLLEDVRPPQGYPSGHRASLFLCVACRRLTPITRPPWIRHYLSLPQGSMLHRCGCFPIPDPA